MGEDPTKVRRSRAEPAPLGDRVPCLEVVAGASAGRLFWIEQRKVVMGRSDRVDLPLDDDGISRQHAKLIVDDDRIVSLVDLGSTNGTFLNDAPVDAAVVRDGDRIRLGADVVLRFAYRSRVDAPGADAPSIELSARELEIARHVAKGRTNGEIAEELGISPHTVMTHLSNVFARTGIASRAELAGLVAGGRARVTKARARR